ncbi:MAG: putative sugar O-methyltransferase [Actinobacteria bacterium]|uniref:Unannotated protein n=1 Tax=freshwater metagenome TaxID=449393 RepID=A0A6J6S369_9ZZZZ|nr:putative sugar O-methyltransferase [Actinomycetota bacterium]MSX71505.1 putative sugar O-methyltransferase [Actinomycetota bacterium]MSY69626.1 putative sugar O-methyltransferase [Actinomycetota bacterium]MTA75418.1 putative sugar O-methyltransferase [Actinomycetota bacterium]
MKDAIFTSLPTSDPIYSSYANASKELLKLVAASRAVGRSQYWTREIESLEYLFDASPSILKRLREHCHWVTGISSYQYANHHFDTPPHLALIERIGELSNRKPNLEIYPERETYGGFGFPFQGNIYNADTLKYHEVIIGLTESLFFLLKKNSYTIVEIGSGYGGLADTLLRHSPNTKLILVDFPEVLLLAWTFIGAWHPEKRIVLFDEKSLVPNSDFDILLVPNNLLGAFQSSGTEIDLMLNTVSFQEMTTSQVQGYIDFANDLGIQFIYSLNRDKSKYNKELTSVSEIIRERYSTEELCILGTEYTAALKKVKNKPVNKIKQSIIETVNQTSPYKHIFGKLRTP